VKQLVTIHISLFVLCTTLLWAIGDFTGYVWVPDRDVYINNPSLGKQLVLATVAGTSFTFFVTVTAAASRWLVPVYWFSENRNFAFERLATV
jgi:hypothetical protein